MKYLLVMLGFLTFACAENYTRSYNPTASVDQIDKTKLLGEFDEISRIVNGQIETSNIKDNTLQNDDFLSNSITGGSIENGTLTPADYANLTAIAAGSMIYATATSTFGEITIGANAKVLTTSALTNSSSRLGFRSGNLS